MTAPGIPRDDLHLCSRRSWSSAGAAVAGTPQISVPALAVTQALALRSHNGRSRHQLSFKRDARILPLHPIVERIVNEEIRQHGTDDSPLRGPSLPVKPGSRPACSPEPATIVQGRAEPMDSPCAAAQLASRGPNRSRRRTRPQIAHHHHIPPQVTIVRKGHAFDGQNLAAIGSLSRRGVLFVLVSLPDGSRSLIPAKWTDWEGSGFEDSVSSDHSTAANHLARLHDLLHLRKVLDAVQSQLDQRVLPVERPDATETCAFQSSQSAAGDLDPSSRIDRVGRHRRDLAPDSVGSSCAPHRPDAGCRAREGGTR